MTKHLIAAIGIVGILKTGPDCRTTAPTVPTTQPAPAAQTMPNSVR